MNSFYRAMASQLVGHKMIHEASNQRVTLENPYPPPELSDDAMVDLLDNLNDCMPGNGIIADLKDWDIQLYDGMADDWYFLAVFGDESNIDGCAEQLAEFFLEKCNELDLDYDQHEDEEWFKGYVLEQAKEFLIGWRRKVIRKFGSDME